MSAIGDSALYVGFGQADVGDLPEFDQRQYRAARTMETAAVGWGGERAGPQ